MPDAERDFRPYLKIVKHDGTWDVTTYAPSMETAKEQAEHFSLKPEVEAVYIKQERHAQGERPTRVLSSYHNGQAVR